MGKISIWPVQQHMAAWVAHQGQGHQTIVHACDTSSPAGQSVALLSETGHPHVLLGMSQLDIRMPFNGRRRQSAANCAAPLALNGQRKSSPGQGGICPGYMKV